MSPPAPSYWRSGSSVRSVFLRIVWLLLCGEFVSSAQPYGGARFDGT
ncbi:MAG: hypothetical protein AB7F50_09460 [Fimbriimonadaceae bacterium]